MGIVKDAVIHSLEAWEKEGSIVIVKKHTINGGAIPPGKHGPWPEYMLAPRPPVYQSERLNELLDGLVPDLKPDPRRSCGFAADDENLRFGELYFSEPGGKEGIRIILYPDREMARDVLRGKVPLTYISLEGLKGYKFLGFFERTRREHNPDLVFTHR